jgi:chromatin assembly factor 1 subunit A
MADIESAPQITFAVASKRPHEDDNEPTVSTPKRVTMISDVDSPLSALSSIASPSPLKVSQAPSGTTTSTTAPQPLKRRKLTPLEKEQQRQEKEANDKARAEKKAQKDAEEKLKAEQKAQRDEEKRVKDEEKRKRAEEREDKKRAKELEQQKKEVEKLKKNRQQLRLNNFFVKKDSGADGVGNAVVDVNQNSTPVELVTVDTNACPVSPQKLRVQKAKSAYDGYFFPFQLPSHATMAPYNHYAEDPTRIAEAESRLQKLIAQENVEMDPMSIESIKYKFTANAGRGVQTSSFAEIVNRINSSSGNPVDLTYGEGDSRDPLQLLKEIPMKYLHFGEDVRPPYWGTYTKPHSKREALKLARNPISRTLRETDYDYDSEAEWEELDGEDLGSDDDEDMDDEADDDMDGFLDDENDPLLKRRHITTDNEPVSTGLCWEDAEGVSRLNDGSDAISTEFKAYKLGFLLGKRVALYKKYQHI